ncbi:MAG TPA: thioredoxin family protein [Opitutaceae bacterium]|jgi:thioredoxin-related protein|nr:thioredoxin family protein [Opitutaceae bacterium]
MKNLLIICALAMLAIVMVFRTVKIHAGGNPVNAAAANAPRAPNDTWLTDMAAARQQAASENKKLLLDFTGSDWCGYCKLLEAEVLNTDAFKDFAKDYVLVRIDFPRSTELPPDLKQQNDALAQQFSVDGFPTLLVMDSSGREITRQSGYEPGSGPQAYLSKFR